MRKILTVSLISFLALAVGAFFISWYLQAWIAKKSVVDTIARLNTDSPYITYSAIETSGFPKNVFVTIMNPRFTGQVDTLLQSIKTTAPDGKTTSPFDGMKEWNEDAMLEGSVTLGVNAMSDDYTMRISGNWKNTSTLKGKTIAAVAGVSKGDTICTLQLAHGDGLLGNMWNFKLFSDDKQGYNRLKDLRLVDCSNPASTFSDQSTNDVLASRRARALLHQQRRPEKTEPFALLSQKHRF